MHPFDLKFFGYKLGLFALIFLEPGYHSYDVITYPCKNPVRCYDHIVVVVGYGKELSGYVME